MGEPQHSLGTLTVVGVGLIGGSLAGALKAAGCVSEVIGYSRSQRNLRQALELGLIDRWTTDLTEAVAGANIVVLAAPVLAVENIFARLADTIGNDTLVTDVSSVKQPIIKAARTHLGENFTRFVPAHPIAGSEKSGATAARTTLFRNHWTIVTPVSETDSDAVTCITGMWRAVGSRLIEMPAADHDRLLAMTSHLPHALAYALVAQLGEQVGSDASLQLAAGGFYDISRIASSDPVMWRDIFLSNRKQVVARLQEYRESLGSLADLIAAGDAGALTEWLERARDLRERIGALRPRNGAP